MYRLLAGPQGRVRERRDQLTHPAYARPELLACRPNEVWSWDISKLKGPAKCTCFYLYVILDLFSRYAVDWTVQYRESAELAKALIAQACKQQQIERDQLTVHADRGSAMRSKPVAFLLADLGVLKDAQPALHLDRQPVQRGALQDAEVPARVPRAVRQHRAGTRVLQIVLRLVQQPAPPLGDRPHDPGRRPPRTRDRAPRRPPARPRSRLHRATRALRQRHAEAAHAADSSVDQQARHQGGRSLNSNADVSSGLTGSATEAA
jgi:hypothetical protein